MRLGRKNSGFSLVELMIVVAIIGILAALAAPRFATFQAKARQSEAKTNLAHIYTLQVSYQSDNNVFDGTAVLSGTDTAGATNCNVTTGIGFKTTDCTKVRYGYYGSGATASAFVASASEINGATATARKVWTGCTSGIADSFSINEAKTLTPVAHGC